MNFKFASKLQSLVEKLSGWFKSKWSTKVQKLQQAQGHNAFPSFSDFVNEVTFLADRMNIPQTSQLLTIKSNSRSTTNVSTTSHRKGPQGFVSQGSSITLTTQTTTNTKDAPAGSESKGVPKPLKTNNP